MTAPHSRPVVSGEQVKRHLRYTRESIAEFARSSGDANPIHSDQQAAQRARHGEIIASGQQTAGQLMGLAATWFSRNDDGCEREMLCLNLNFAFKAPVFAEQELMLTWEVGEVEWSSRLSGWIAQANGSAKVGGRACVIARGTFLVRAVVSAAAPQAPSAPEAP